jgi:hypothetical protein
MTEQQTQGGVFKLPVHLFIFLLVLVALIFGLWAALNRLGWGGTTAINVSPVSHGPLMVSGFLGTLIALERAVALQKRWVFIGPILSGLGGLALIILNTDSVGQTLIALSSLIMFITLIGIVRQILASYTIVMTTGTFLWLVGNILWLINFPIYRIVYWWVGFFVLTIASERLELSRVRRLSTNSQRLFTIIIISYILSLILSLWFFNLGVRLIAVSTIALSIWLYQNDIARISIRQQGLPRYAAICLLSGYFWLGISGILGLLYGGLPGGLQYDAVLHSVLLGFVFSMIFGHAPIIFPAVLKKTIGFHPVLFAPLIGLHISLAIRIIGDILFLPVLRKWGGLLNEIVIILFFIVLFYLVQLANKSALQHNSQQISYT